MPHPVAVRTAAFANLCALLLLAAPAHADPAADAALGRFAKTLDGMNDYTATLFVHEALGSRTQDRTVVTDVMRPSWVKVAVIDGDGKGGVAVWNGGTSVRGHQGGLLRFITLTVGLHDPKATSLRGGSIENGTLMWQLDHLRSLQTKLTMSPGPIVEGQPTDLLTADGVDPKSDQGMTRELFFLSRSTGLPLRFEGYEGDVLVRRTEYTNIKLNVGLKESDFTL